MYSRILFKQTVIRTIKTTSAKSKTNLGNNIRIPSVKINTTMSHSITNDIKSLQQSRSTQLNQNRKSHIPSLSSDDESLETVIPYIRVWGKETKKKKKQNNIIVHMKHLYIFFLTKRCFSYIHTSRLYFFTNILCFFSPFLILLPTSSLLYIP